MSFCARAARWGEDLVRCHGGNLWLGAAGRGSPKPRYAFRDVTIAMAMRCQQCCRRTQGLVQEKHRKTTYLSISKSSKFNTGCVNHLFRSVAFWTGHMLSHYHMQRWSTLFAARCPRLLWHRCFPISTFFVSHSVRIVWFGFACLPSWPSLPAWAWFMSTCQQGRPEETVFHSVFYCFGMLWHSHNLFEHLPLHPWTFFASFWEAQCRPSDLNLFPFTMVHHFCSSKRS